MLNPVYPSKKPLAACDNPLCFDCLVSPCEDARLIEARAQESKTLQDAVRKARTCVNIEREKLAKFCGLDITRYRKIQAWAERRWLRSGCIRDFHECRKVERAAWVKYVENQL